MKFKDIEVSGIKRIVINHKKVWEYYPSNTWMVLRPGESTESFRPHNEMMKIVNILKEDRRYRMWVHGDTLNIERKRPKDAWCCLTCGKCSEKPHDHYPTGQGFIV